MSTLSATYWYGFKVCVGQISTLIV